MYRLFLCLRYLRLKFIAYLPMAAVALCVAMMLIVISVMNGFLHKIEIAARGLYGDIILDTGGARGIAYYDEFGAELRKQLPKQNLPGVRPLLAEEIKSSPFIYTGGILDWRSSRQMVQVAGIRLPERTGVSEFADGLCFEKGLSAPSFDPPLAHLAQRAATSPRTWTRCISSRNGTCRRSPPAGGRNRMCSTRWTGRRRT